MVQKLFDFSAKKQKYNGDVKTEMKFCKMEIET
jgi:hypothetical protein